MKSLKTLSSTNEMYETSAYLNRQIVLNKIVFEIIPHETQGLSFFRLIKEWNIWSKCFGKIIVINGCSSSGKTTIINYFKKYGFNDIVLDDDFYQTEFNWIDGKIPNVILDNYQFMKIYNKMYDTAKKFIYSGQNVIIETVMFNDAEIDRFIYCFNYYPVSICLLYSPLDTNLKNCFLRNEKAIKTGYPINCRNPATIIDQYCNIYNFTSDTDLLPKQKILDLIDKISIQNILSKAIENVSIFLENFCFSKVDEYSQEYYFIKAMDIIGYTTNIITTLSNNIIITPIIKYDFIIRKSNEKETLYDILFNKHYSNDMIEFSLMNLQIDEIITSLLGGVFFTNEEL